MNLREFVTETLVEIAAGIEDAQKQLQDSGSTAEINPYMTKDGSDKWVTGGRRKNVEIVEFDVAILASEDTNAKAGIALKVASVIDLNAGGSSKQSTGTESRIKFKIPAAFNMRTYTQE